MKEEVKIFNDLKSLGSFLRAHRRIRKLDLENVAKTLLIKKNILHKFEEGDITIYNLKSQSHLRGFLNSYIKFLKVEKICKLELSTGNSISNLEKSNLHLETSGYKKHNYGSFIILLSLIMLGLTYLIWNKNTYINLYILGTSIK